MSGEDIDPRQRAKDTQVLTKAQQSLAAAGRQNSAAYDDAGKILKTYAAAETQAGTKAKFLTAASVKLQVAIKGVAAAAAIAGKVLNVAFLAFGAAQLVGSLFDVDLIGMITDAFKDLSQRTADLNNGLVGLTVAAAGGGTALSDAIKRITVDEKVLEEIPKKIREISAAIEDDAKRSLGLKDQVGFSSTIQIERELMARQELGRAEVELADARKANNAEDVESAKVRIEIIEAIIKRIGLFSAELTGLAGELQRSTGLAGDKVADSFRAGALGVEQLNGKLFIAGVELDKVNGKFTSTDLPKSQQEAVDAQIIFNSVLKETNEAFSAGALNSDKLSAKIAGLSSQILEIEEKGGLAGISPGPGAVQEATKLREEVEKLRDLQKELKSLESISKGIAKAFSSAFTALDTAPFKGVIDLSGNLAENTEQAKKNQAEFLTSIIETNKKFADQVKNQREGEKLDSIITERAQNFNLAVKAAAGSIIEYYQTAQKVVQAEKVKAQQLDKQLQSLKEQQVIQKMQRDNASAVETEKQLRDAAQARFNQEEKALELRQLTFDLAQKELVAAEKLAKAQAANDATRLKIAQIGRQTGANANEAARGLNQGILENQLAILNEKSFKDQTAINAKKRELIELERQYADERFAEQKSLIEAERDDSLTQLETQKGIEKERLNRLNDEKSALDQFNKDQLALFDRQSALETQKLTDQKTQLERERQIVLSRASAQLKSSEADEKIFNQQSQLTIAQLKGYQSFTETVNTFVSATGDKSPFVQAVAEILGVAQGADAGTAFRDNLVKIPQQTSDALLEAITSTQGNINKQGEIFKLQRKGITDQALGESNLNNLKQDGVTDQIQNQQKLRIIERDILSTTLAGKAQELAAEIKLQKTKLEGLPLQELELRAQATQKIEELDQQRIKTLETLNQRVDTLARSEDRLGQALDQSQSIVKESFTGAFMKLNDALIDGSITMGMVANTFKDMVGNMLREIQQAVFRKTIVDPLTDAISGSIPGLGSLFGGGGTPIKTPAAGGRVHMAQGGMPNAATMKRDRVPAMLEPGEFVMRKEAVKQAGLGAMMRMNAAPQQLQSGGQVMQGNATYSVARAMELEAMGLSASQARAVAQDEANKSKSVGGAFSFSNSKINSMKGAPSTSTPATPSNALKAVQDMLGIGKQSSLQTSGTTQTAGLFDFLDRGLSNSPSDVKSRQERFKGGKKSKSKEKGVIDTVLGYVGLASAGIMNDASSAYSQFVGGSGIAGSVGLKPLERDPKIMEALLGGTKVTGAPSSTASVNQFELQNAITNKAIQNASFDPTGNLANVLGADGFRGIPISIIGAMLGFDVPNLFARAPSPASLSARKARAVVTQRTGQMPTGYKGSFKPG